MVVTNSRYAQQPQQPQQPQHQPTSVRRLLMIVKAKTVMRGCGQRAAFTIQIVTPVVNALHAFRKGTNNYP